MKRGFVQIPILLVIIICATVIGGGGYFVVKETSKPPVEAETQIDESAEATVIETEEQEEKTPQPLAPVIQNPPAPQQPALLPVQTQKTQPLSPPATTTIQASTTVVASTTAPTVTPITTPIPKVKVTADPSDIEYDGTSTISWIATDALSCTIDSSPVLLSTTGSQSVTPTDPKEDWADTNKTTYTLTCTGAGGSASGSVSIIIQPWVPPAGYDVRKDCSPSKAPCITGPGGMVCSGGGCSV